MIKFVDLLTFMGAILILISICVDFILGIAVGVFEGLRHFCEYYNITLTHTPKPSNAQNSAKD